MSSSSTNIHQTNVAESSSKSVIFVADDGTVETERLYSTASGLVCLEDDGIPSAPCAPYNVAVENPAAINHGASRRQPTSNMPTKNPPIFFVSSSSSYSSSFSSSSYSSSTYPPPPPPSPPSPPSPPPPPNPPTPPPPSTWMHGWVDERVCV